METTLTIPSLDTTIDISVVTRNLNVRLRKKQFKIREYVHEECSFVEPAPERVNAILFPEIVKLYVPIHWNEQYHHALKVRGTVEEVYRKVYDFYHLPARMDILSKMEDDTRHYISKVLEYEGTEVIPLWIDIMGDLGIFEDITKIDNHYVLGLMGGK